MLSMSLEIEKFLIWGEADKEWRTQTDFFNIFLFFKFWGFFYNDFKFLLDSNAEY